MKDNHELPVFLKSYLRKYSKDKYDFYVYNIQDKKLVGTYTNQREAATILEIDHRNINSCLSGIKNLLVIILLYIYKRFR
ncbi:MULTISPECIES: NUMOD1 domain-containing DNA-binding protein [Bacillus]|uniref:NUMOD1 domain-containing DNA-binding protein n=1 Tax=Bacillus TaxID=1386 RepID=UPI0015D48A9B